jgi:hypothetical protein
MWPLWVTPLCGAVPGGDAQAADAVLAGAGGVARCVGPGRLPLSALRLWGRAAGGPQVHAAQEHPQPRRAAAVRGRLPLPPGSPGGPATTATQPLLAHTRDPRLGDPPPSTDYVVGQGPPCFSVVTRCCGDGDSRLPVVCRCAWPALLPAEPLCVGWYCSS